MEPPLSGGQPGDRGASLPWIITLPTRFYTPTVSVDGGAVYAGAWDGNVYALSAYDGTTAWTFNTGGRVRASPMPSPAGDLVVVGSTNGTLYGIGAADGQERWRSDALGGGIEGTAAFMRDGKVVFAGGGDGGLAALDSQTGATLWTTLLGHSPLLAAPALSPDGETLVASCNTTLHALRTSSGARVWSAELASPVGYSTAVVSGEGDRVFVATEDGRVHALNTTTGGKLWSVHTQATITASPTFHPKLGLVLIGSWDGNLYALRPKDGSQAWMATVGQVSYSEAVLSPDGDLIYIGSGDHQLYALEATNGHIRWRRDLGAEVAYSPAVSPDGVIVYAGSYFLRTLQAIASGDVPVEGAPGPSTTPDSHSSMAALLSGHASSLGPLLAPLMLVASLLLLTFRLASRRGRPVGFKPVPTSPRPIEVAVVVPPQ